MRCSDEIPLWPAGAKTAHQHVKTNGSLAGARTRYSAALGEVVAVYDDVTESRMRRALPGGEEKCGAWPMLGHHLFIIPARDDNVSLPQRFALELAEVDGAAVIGEPRKSLFPGGC